MLFEQELMGANIFFLFWLLLDAIFTYIDGIFRSIYIYIPYTAIIFVEAIFFYSVLAFLEWYAEKLGEGNERVGVKICYISIMIFMILFSCWRIGIIALAEDNVTYEALSELLINLAYIVFAGILIIAFLKKIPWLKKAIIVFTWGMFTLFTWIICPALGEIEYSPEMLYQFVFILMFFAVPNSMLQYQNYKKSGVND